MSNITSEESLLLQCLSTTALLGELANANFLDSDYFRHIRNAVAHSKCNYFSENQKNFVVFTDDTKSDQCSIKMECYKVGLVLMELQKLIMEYYNDKHIR